MVPRGLPTLVGLSLLLPGCALFGGGRSGEAEKLSEFFTRAKSHHENGREREALDQVEKGLDLDPGDEKLRLLRGFIYLQLARQDPTWLDDAQAQFEELAGGSLLSRGPLEANLGLGMTLHGQAQQLLRYAEGLEKGIREGRVAADRRAGAVEAAAKARAEAPLLLERAEGHLQEVLDRQGNHIQALYHLALVESELGRTAQALERIRRYIEAAQRRRQEILERELRVTLDRDLEERLWRDLRALESRERECRGLAANLLYKLERFAEACQELDGLLALDPGRIHELYNRARCHQKLGRLEQAARDFRSFVGGSLLPREDPRIQEALAFLSRQEGEPK